MCVRSFVFSPFSPLLSPTSFARGARREASVIIIRLSLRSVGRSVGRSGDLSVCLWGGQPVSQSVSRQTHRRHHLLLRDSSITARGEGGGGDAGGSEVGAGCVSLLNFYFPRDAE